jgi:hypothetical protein
MIVFWILHLQDCSDGVLVYVFGCALISAFQWYRGLLCLVEN